MQGHGAALMTPLNVQQDKHKARFSTEPKREYRQAFLREKGNTGKNYMLPRILFCSFE